jgi:recombination protein RecT
MSQNAVATPTKSLSSLLESMKTEIARCLPKHLTADRMTRIALTEVRKNKDLAICDQASFLGAIMQCSQLGLEPGGILGHAYLLPFDNKKAGKKEVQLIIGYKGLLDLARRSGQIKSMEAREVFANDKFRVSFGLNPELIHEPNFAAGDRGPLTHVYAVAHLVGGGTQFEVMSLSEVQKVRQQSKAGNFGPWVTHFNEMAKKTALRRLFKYLPVSLEIQHAVALDETEARGTVIDGEYTESTVDISFGGVDALHERLQNEEVAA